MAIILILLKASVLLAAALAGAWLLRGAPAAMRHTLWSVTFAALLALPVLDGAVPALHVPVPDGWSAAAPGQETPSVARSTSGAAAPAANMPGLPGLKTRPAQAVLEPPPQPGFVFDMRSIRALARLVWLAGTLAAIGALLLSLVRVRRLSRTAAEVTEPAWHAAVATLGARLALRRPVRVLMNDAVRTPMAGGVWRPLIFVPADASSWTAERRDVVLAHELSHIARRDPLRHLAARFAVACYWFHPLAWLAARQSSLAREQACDEAVLALGVRPSDYARVLLELAETMAPSRRAATALLMVERSLLEARLMAILDHHTTASRLRHPFVPAAGAALLALTVAAVQPAARSIDVRVPSPVTQATVVLPIAPRYVVASPAAPSQARRDGSCWLSGTDRDDFTGYTNTNSSGTILERVGTSGGNLIIQQRFGETRVCMRAENGAKDGRDTPTTWAGRASRLIIETDRGGSTAHLDVSGPAGRASQTTWRVNGAERPFDAAAQAWRDAVLAVLDRTWEISTLRGEVSTLRGEISTVRGEESTLRGEISTLRGDVSTMRGRQSTIQGEESTLRGEISQIQGHLSTLHGQISTEQGTISALTASRYGLNDADRKRVADLLKSHDAEIERIQREIRNYDAQAKIAAVERQLRELDAHAKVAAIETEIRNFGEAGKAGAIEKQIEALNVDGQIAKLEQQILALDADRRTRQMQDRLDDAIKQLEKTLAGIK